MSDDAPRKFFVLRFADGFGCAWRAVPFVLGRRRLRRLAVLPFLICLVIYIVLFAVAIAVAGDVADMMVGEATTWWLSVLRAAVVTTGLVLFVIVAAFTYTVTCFVLAGPLYEWLSAAVEREVTGQVSEEPFSIRAMLGDMARGVTYALLLLFIELWVLLFGLVFVPVTTALAFAGSAVLLSMEYMEYPMERRRMGLRARFAFARRHFWEVLGLGLPILLGLLIPFVGPLSLPVGVVGGTLLFLQVNGPGEVRQD